MNDFLSFFGFIYLCVLLCAWTLRIGIFLFFLGFWLCYLPFAWIFGWGTTFPKEIAALVCIETDDE